jgi:hypothetical protein
MRHQVTVVLLLLSAFVGACASSQKAPSNEWQIQQRVRVASKDKGNDTCCFVLAPPSQTTAGSPICGRAICDFMDREQAVRYAGPVENIGVPIKAVVGIKQ